MLGPWENFQGQTYHPTHGTWPISISDLQYDLTCWIFMNCFYQNQWYKMVGCFLFCQVIANSCATHALLSVLLNCENKI